MLFYLLKFFLNKKFQVFPFSYILMTNKTQISYEDVFKYINKNILQLQGVSSFTSDFEVAMRNGIKKLFPDSKRFTCYFHFCQAVKKRASQTDGFAKLIGENKRAK